MIKIWGRRNSFNVQKVLWLVGELGLEFEHVPAGGSFGRLDELALRALNPHGRIPVIEDGAVVVWESHAILRYLAASYGRGGLWSEDPADRAAVDQWMEWSQTALQPELLNGIFWGYFRTPPAQRDLAAIERSVQCCAQHYRLLDRLLAQQPFVAGGDLSLADIPIGTSLYRYFGMDIEHPSIPNVQAWYRRLQQRPAYREHVMVSFEDLRGRLDY